MARGTVSVNRSKVLDDMTKIRDRVAKRLVKAREQAAELAQLEELHAENEATVKALGGEPFSFDAPANDTTDEPESTDHITDDDEPNYSGDQTESPAETAPARSSRRRGAPVAE